MKGKGFIYYSQHKAGHLQLIYEIVFTGKEQTEWENLFFCQYIEELY